MTRIILAVFALALALSACGSSGDTCSTITTSGPWTIFSSADGGPNTVVGAATGTVKSCTENGKSRVLVDVTLLSPDGGASANRAYGGHVHVASCATSQAGGHYRNDADAGASASNEVWLDFTTNDAGVGKADTTAGWAIRRGEAKAVVIHDHATDATGAAGPKLVCVDVPF